jgi:hypothetical protein
LCRSSLGTPDALAYQKRSWGGGRGLAQSNRKKSAGHSFQDATLTLNLMGILEISQAEIPSREAVSN